MRDSIGIPQNVVMRAARKINLSLLLTKMGKMHPSTMGTFDCSLIINKLPETMHILRIQSAVGIRVAIDHGMLSKRAEILTLAPTERIVHSGRKKLNKIRKAWFGR